MHGGDTAKLRRWLWTYGHFFGTGVREVDLDKLNPGDDEFRAAVKSIQDLDINCDKLCHHYHGRPLIADGDVGPATMKLLSLPRCGQPDYGGFGLGGEALVQATATGSGSWPAPGCDPQATHKELHSTVLWIDPTGSPYSAERLQESIDLAVKCNVDAGMQLRVVVGRERPSPVNLILKFGRTSGSVIGWFYIYQRGSGCTTLNGVLSNRYSPSNIYMHAGLIVHEACGHGWGMGHTRGGIMNPSMVLVEPLTYRGDPAWGTVRRYFGGAAIPTEPPEPPPWPEPDPEPDPQPDPEPDPQPDPQPDPEPDPEPDPQPDPEPDPQPERPIMDWIRDIIVELIRSCIDNNESRTSIRSSMRSPTGGQKRLLERRVRKRAGMSWSEWAREGGRERLMAPVYAEGAAAQDDELDAMIDDASDVDFV